MRETIIVKLHGHTLGRLIYRDGRLVTAFRRSP